MRIEQENREKHKNISPLPPALGMGVLLLCRRPSAWGFSPLPPALGHGLPSSAAGPRPWPCFQVFEFSSFRFFKFSNFHKCFPPSLPPFSLPTPEILAETKLECKTLGWRIFSSFQVFAFLNLRVFKLSSFRVVKFSSFQFFLKFSSFEDFEY